ncbi:HYC_CC_PP family protein [Chitinophaga lutea]
MKTFLLCILSLVYLTSATGATLHLHYCDGKLKDVRLWHAEDEACGKQDKRCMKDCCKDEHQTLKLKQEHQAAHLLHVEKAPAEALLPPFFQPQWLFTDTEVPALYSPFVPPPPDKVRPHVFLCTFRI